MCNLFIAENFPNLFKKFLEKKKIKKFDFLGFQDDQIKNLILMFKFLSNWLYYNRLTKYKTEINVDF